MKPEDLIEPEDEEDENEEAQNPVEVERERITPNLRFKDKGFLQIGELIVGTQTGGIKACSVMAKKLLRDRNIKKYLGIIEKRKNSPFPNYVE